VVDQLGIKLPPGSGGRLRRYEERTDEPFLNKGGDSLLEKKRQFTSGGAKEVRGRDH